ncbi:uncharacterized protein BYT42DRAFT_82365 [Radiomyces spectabilis]|uniref:uncharacterized protein n=1 Tax=Radiomyces spectabilis TaxID=64574 RepID=UPI00221E7056|nr:uncharacterized protein BYT42DRAFT_82365 [Radiomyces spectabilis]KAI8371800.1 hypothetical protein BYT42DRAFT_82365 [Radiomyces spectabilis]
MEQLEFEAATEEVKRAFIKLAKQQISGTVVKVDEDHLEQTDSSESSDSNLESASEDLETEEGQWRVGTINITTVLQAFRNTCFQKFIDGESLGATELMSLNYIYHFDVYGKTDCRGYLPGTFDEIEAEVLEDLEQNEQLSLLPEAIKAMCNMLKDATAIDRAKPTEMNSMMLKANGPQELLAARALCKLYAKYEKDEDLMLMDEDTFADHTIKPLYETLISTISRASSAGQFATMICKNKGEKDWILRPDSTLCTTMIGKSIPCFTMEIKAPHGPFGGDLLKISYEMKQMLNSLVEQNVEDPVVFGAVVEGVHIKTYKMDLKYHHTYRLIQLRSFYLPRERSDFGVVEGALMAMFQLRALISETVAKIRQQPVETEQTKAMKSWRRHSPFAPNFKYGVEYLD